MTIKAFLTNVGDIVEAFGKKIGLGDTRSKQVGDAAAEVLGNFLTKWVPDAMHTLLADAAPFALSVKNGSLSFEDAAKQLLDKALVDELQVTLDDAKDAVRTHLIAPPPATASATSPAPAQS